MTHEIYTICEILTATMCCILSQDQKYSTTNKHTQDRTERTCAWVCPYP